MYLYIFTDTPWAETSFLCMESPLGPVRGRHVEPGASAGLHPDPKWSARQRLTRTASAGEWKLPSSSSRVTLAARAAPQVTAHALVDLVASAPCLSPVITALKHHGVTTDHSLTNWVARAPIWEHFDKNAVEDSHTSKVEE